MNNFVSPNSDAHSKVPRHLETLTTTAFQSLFPPINPQTTPLKSIRRVLLLNREESEDGTFVLNFRHYAITTKPVGLSRPLRRLNAAEKMLKSKNGKGGLPNLSKLRDISEFMIGGEDGQGYQTDGTSGSEPESDAEVEVLETATRKVHSGKPKASEQNSDDEGGAHDNVERRAVKLVELGPRMRLRMTKVEEGLCAGKVMWHEYVHKTPEEIKELEARWEKRRKEKEARKKQQKENVEKKRKAKEEARKASGGGERGGESEEEDDDGDKMDVDDAEYSDLYSEDEFDSEGLAGDAEEQVNAQMEDQGEWESEEEEIASEAKPKKKALKG
jgi:ribosome biogenesis protein SSF1/2